ncbi:putative 3-methyladenine DNA glycosylase [bioreactor metagenome]|uniref:Putative 3-methyladenine DNA glycosylase n=1 Tax=bioreactor metagenome TaxID=1076179 RepID=A0A645J7G3_9ZZZZ
MFEAGGVSYIYFIYGLYYCFNVVATEKGIPEAVLIRAIEPIEGIEEMSLLRYKKNLDELNKTELKGIGNGPAKLCTALKLDKSLNGVDLTGDTLYIEDIGYEDFQIVETTRVGIDYAEEARDFLWRFYIKDNKYISKK